MTVELEEAERQATVLALAELALTRPGWNQMLSEIADKFAGLDMFEELKVLNADRVRMAPL